MQTAQTLNIKISFSTTRKSLWKTKDHLLNELSCPALLAMPEERAKEKTKYYFLRFSFQFPSLMLALSVICVMSMEWSSSTRLNPSQQDNSAAAFQEDYLALFLYPILIQPELFRLRNGPLPLTRLLLTAKGFRMEIGGIQICGTTQMGTAS